MKDESHALDEVVRQARSLLVFHRQCGLDYPLSKGLQHFLTPAERHIGSPPPAGETPAVTVADQKASAATLDELRNAVEDCHRCPLGSKGERMIFGEGSAGPGTPLFIICDPPGPAEMARHEPMSGEARALLAKMLGAIGLSPADIYLTNIVKCAPPGQRSPASAEATACQMILTRQLALVRPRIICTMGQTASQLLLKTTQPLVGLRGRFHDLHGTPLMATFHPSQLLKFPELKKGSWHDLQLIRQRLERNRS